MTSLPSMGGRAQTEREPSSVVVRVELCVLWGVTNHLSFPRMSRKVPGKWSKWLCWCWRRPGRFSMCYTI